MSDDLSENSGDRPPLIIVGSLKGESGLHPSQAAAKLSHLSTVDLFWAGDPVRRELLREPPAGKRSRLPEHLRGLRTTGELNAAIKHAAEAAKGGIENVRIVKLPLLGGKTDESLKHFLKNYRVDGLLELPPRRIHLFGQLESYLFPTRSGKPSKEFGSLSLAVEDAARASFGRVIITERALRSARLADMMRLKCGSSERGSIHDCILILSRGIWDAIFRKGAACSKEIFAVHGCPGFAIGETSAPMKDLAFRLMNKQRNDGFLDARFQAWMHLKLGDCRVYFHVDHKTEHIYVSSLPFHLESPASDGARNRDPFAVFNEQEAAAHDQGYDQRFGSSLSVEAG